MQDGKIWIRNLIMAFLLPWISTAGILYSLGLNLKDTFFYLYGLTINIPGVGDGFFVGLISWAFAGILIGATNKKALPAVGSVVIALIVTGLVFFFTPSTVGLPAYWDPRLDPVLLSNQLSGQSFGKLLLQMFYTTASIPAALFFTLSGVNRNKKRITKIVKKQAKDSGAAAGGSFNEPTEDMGSAEPAASEDDGF